MRIDYGKARAAEKYDRFDSITYFQFGVNDLAVIAGNGSVWHQFCQNGSLEIIRLTTGDCQNGVRVRQRDGRAVMETLISGSSARSAP
jgi:hypothetical protein